MNLDHIKLTRVPRWDSRNNEHLVQEYVPNLPRTKTHARQVWLNQGATPACTGYSGAQALSMAPHSLKNSLGGSLDKFAYNLYRMAQKKDEWPGENYDGSSILGAAQALKEYGYITQYNWAKNADDVAQALLRYPVLIGIKWKSNMFKPDGNGLLSVTGTDEGGHAICVGGFKDYGELFRVDNTWGRDWGIQGSAWLAKEDLNFLLSQDNGGEAVVPVKAIKAFPDLSVLPQAA